MEIELDCFIGRRFNLKPYIKDIRIDSVLFHHFTWTKAYATQMSENWISRDCHNETANEGKEASGADQLSTRDRSADCSRLFWCHISLMRNRKIYVCTYTERKLKIYQYAHNLDNYFLYFGVSLFSISNLMLVCYSPGSSSIQNFFDNGGHEM